MSLKDTWTPQDTTMDASPDIPNMLADAIIQNEEDIADLKENGVDASVEPEIMFVGLNNSYEPNKTYNDVYYWLCGDENKERTAIMVYSIDNDLINDIFYLRDWEMDYMTFVSAKNNVIKTLTWKYDNTCSLTATTLATEDTLDEAIGDIETALDNIIAIQNELMGVSE